MVYFNYKIKKDNNFLQPMIGCPIYICNKQNFDYSAAVQNIAIEERKKQSFIIKMTNQGNRIFWPNIYLSVFNEMHERIIYTSQLNVEPLLCHNQGIYVLESNIMPLKSGNYTVIIDVLCSDPHSENKKRINQDFMISINQSGNIVKLKKGD